MNLVTDFAQLMASNVRHGRKLFQILIQFCSLFYLCSCGGVTIISYPDLGHDFAEFMIDYKYFQKTKELPEPYSQEVEDELRHICRDIRYARTFEIVPKAQKEIKNVLNYAQSEDISHQRDVKYKDIKVRVYDFDDSIPMFPCYRDLVHGYIYVTPGFNRDFKFLFKRRDLQSNPILYALVEPRPVIDESFNDQRHLEKYFVQAYRMYKLRPKNRLSASTLNGHQHFRLCSLLEDARRIYAKAGELEEEDKKDEKDKHFLDIEHHEEIEEIVDVTFMHLNQLNPVYATLEINVATLPCYSDGGNDTFFVSENPKDPNSVFVLELRINPDSLKREVSVVQYVSDIALLKNLDKFYKK